MRGVASTSTSALPRLTGIRAPMSRAFSSSSSALASASDELRFPTKPNPSPFEIFHLDPKAPIEPKALKARFYQLSRLYHPDLRNQSSPASPTSDSSTTTSGSQAKVKGKVQGKGKEKEKEEDGSSEFRQIVEAYEVLRDERKRAVYLRSGRAGPASRGGWNDPGYNFARGRPMANSYARGAYPSAAWDWT